MGLTPGTDEAQRIAERVRELIAKTPIESDGASINVTVSIGLATFKGDLESQEELVGAADRLLYAAKKGGRNRLAC